MNKDALRDPNHAATLAAWRACGDDSFDPVRFRFIESLAARADAHDGDARRLLDHRLGELLAAYRDNMARAPRVDDPAPPEAQRGALAGLVDHIARQSPSRRGAPATGDAASRAPELQTLAYFRSTWSRLNAERRLMQALAAVPDNAGPLNSQHLVHRSLMLMRDTSPEYLNRFMAYVDTLFWIEQGR